MCALLGCLWDPLSGMALTWIQTLPLSSWYLLRFMPAHSHERTHGWALQDRNQSSGEPVESRV